MQRFKPIITLPNRLYSSTTTTNYLNNHINYFLSNQTKHLQTLLKTHSFIITSGHTNNIFIASKLISLYASFKIPNASTKVFNSTIFKDPFLWNSIIKAHFGNGLYSQAFEFFTQMRVSNTFPDKFTVPMVVSVCAELGLVKEGMSVHGLVTKLNLFESNAAIGASFVYMYSKCGCMGDAGCVFGEMSVRDVVSWTALVIGYVQNGDSERGLEVLCEMHRVGENEERLNFRTLEGGFQACGKLGAVLEGRCLHGLAVKIGILCSDVVKSSLFWMYSKCGDHEEAYLSFCEVPDKDLMSWTSIVGVFAKSGSVSKCLGLFREMQNAGICPDGMFISCMLSGFGNSMNVFEGKAFHGFIIRANYGNDEMVHNALMSMYCKFGLIVCAEKLFGGRQKPDNEAWNVMLLGYAKARLAIKCIELFRQMQHLGTEFDSNTLVAVISSCTELRAVRECQSLHCFVIKNSMQESVSVANSLIDMYGKVGHLAKAWRIFCSSQKDTVTWNTLISSYAYSGNYANSLCLFDQMVLEGIKPSSATLIIVLSSCSHIASLDKGEQVHNYINEEGLELNLPLATALIDMYAKCGQLGKSRDIFNSMKEKDVVSWNVMISGYGMHGDARSAIELFRQMEQSDVRPNELSFLAILIACTHAGLVEEGKSFFARMSDYSVKPTLKHYSCMVDLLGRSGNLHEAEALALSMPIAADGGIWGTLLSACKIHNNPEMGIRIAKHAIGSEPENDGYYIIISDLYSSIGMSEEAERMRKIMKDRGVKKAAGWSTL